MARSLLAVVVSVLSLAATGCGGGDEPGTGAGSTTTTPPDRTTAAAIGDRPGKLVEIGARRSLFVHCLGTGSPTVVLESGFGADTSQWQAVQPTLARSTRVCAYDRVGVGNSVAPPGVRDAREEIADLRRLLARERIDPPYVLAGHSYGGVVARVFAHLHPRETAGLVLLDTMGRDGRRRSLAIWPESQAPEMRERLATTAIGDVDLAAGEAIASRIRTFGDMPLAVVSATRQEGYERTPARVRRAQTRLWTRMHDELARLSRDGLHVVALRSAHDIPSADVGQPAVVIRAVRAVVRAARDGRRLPPCSRLFSGPDVRCRG